MDCQTQLWLGHVVSLQRWESEGRTMPLYSNSVASDFFETMQIPLLLGRPFSEGEKDVVIVGQSLARAQWPGQNPQRKRVRGGAREETVVGVAGDAHLNALNDNDAVEQYGPAQPEEMPGMGHGVDSAQREGDGKPAGEPPGADQCGRGVAI